MAITSTTKCQATFKEQCTYPRCDCDRPSLEVRKQITAIEEEIDEINKRISRTDSDTFEYYALLKIEGLEDRRSHLLKKAQELEMQEWNL